MRHLFKFALLAGTALAISGCKSQAPAANNVSNEVGLNESLAAPGNDASAVESVANAPLPAPPPAMDSNTAGNSVAPSPPPPSSTPNVESNVAGM
jgi:hypothetical protein